VAKRHLPRYVRGGCTQPDKLICQKKNKRGHQASKTRGKTRRRTSSCHLFLTESQPDTWPKRGADVNQTGKSQKRCLGWGRQRLGERLRGLRSTIDARSPISISLLRASMTKKLSWRSVEQGEVKQVTGANRMYTQRKKPKARWRMPRNPLLSTKQPKSQGDRKKKDRIKERRAEFKKDFQTERARNNKKEEEGKFRRKAREPGMLSYHTRNMLGRGEKSGGR